MKKQQIPQPTELKIKPSQYQPSKSEKQEKYDMPGMSEEELRETFMRPFEVREED